MFIFAVTAILHFCRRLHRADFHACPALQAELHVHKCAVLDKTDGRPGAEIHAPAAPNTLFPVNSNHPASPLSTVPAFTRFWHSNPVMRPLPGTKKNQNENVSIILLFRGCQVIFTFLLQLHAAADPAPPVIRKRPFSISKTAPPSFIHLSIKKWWRCRESNPGHCGYEPHALTT